MRQQRSTGPCTTARERHRPAARCSPYSTGFEPGRPLTFRDARHLTDAEVDWLARHIQALIFGHLRRRGFLDEHAALIAEAAQGLELAALGRWTAGLTLPLAGLILALHLGAPAGPTLIGGLAIFGAMFAANSAIHSFLVVHYADEHQIALDVGFYYMANAAGRLVGTLLSGAVFGALLGRAGLEACLAVSVLFVVLSAALCAVLARSETPPTSCA